MFHPPNPGSRLLLQQLDKFYSDQVQSRRSQAAKNLRESCKILQEILREVEIQEPRFISSLSECNGRFEGVRVNSATEFEVTLYLNQMGVFNFVDDGHTPGCASLKLSDGRKRSMSLWVEFITAAGLLSARKLRTKFQTLVAQACEKSTYRETVKMESDTSDVKLRVADRCDIHIIPAFRCSGVWPRSACQWPAGHALWPCPALVAQVKAEGFDLMSRESHFINSKQTSGDGDSWIFSFTDAENRLIVGGCRRKCLGILKSLRDKHLDLPGNPVTPYVMKTLLLYECEKHPRESDWDDCFLGDRVHGILLQLTACLQCRRCPHFFVSTVDLFRAKSHVHLESAAKQTWRLIRELLVNSKALH